MYQMDGPPKGEGSGNMRFTKQVYTFFKENAQSKHDPMWNIPKMELNNNLSTKWMQKKTWIRSKYLQLLWKTEMHTIIRPERSLIFFFADEVYANEHAPDIFFCSSKKLFCEWVGGNNVVLFLGFQICGKCDDKFAT